MADEAMTEAVKGVLSDAFLKTRGDRDVYVLAASKLAFEYLQDAFKDLHRIAGVSSKEDSERTQVGL